MIVRTVIRVVGVATCLYGLSDANIHIQLSQSIVSSIMMKIVYLTNIGLILTLTTLVIGLLITALDYTSMKETRRALKRIHWCIAEVNVGMETIVFLGYWILYWMDRSLVASTMYKDPVAKEMSMHVLPFFFALYEGWIAKSQRSWINHVIFLVFAIFYYSLSKYASTKNAGKWQYKFLTNMSTLGRVLACVGFMVLGQVSIEVFIFCRRRLKGHQSAPRTPSHALDGSVGSAFTKTSPH